jgi:hypothetical protein
MQTLRRANITTNTVVLYSTFREDVKLLISLANTWVSVNAVLRRTALTPPSANNLPRQRGLTNLQEGSLRRRMTNIILLLFLGVDWRIMLEWVLEWKDLDWIYVARNLAQCQTLEHLGSTKYWDFFHWGDVYETLSGQQSFVPGRDKRFFSSPWRPDRLWGFFFILDCEAIGTAATPGLLCQPRVIVKMIVEK